MGNNKQHVTEKYVTGKGELTGFIAITKPSTKFNKDGVYSINILLPQKEGEALVQKIKDIRTKQFKEYGKGTKVVEITKCKPYEIVDKETGEGTPDKEGRYILAANASAYIENGKPKKKIIIYNAKCKPITGNINVGEGTIATLGITLSGYSVAGKTGVSVKLEAVQIIKLVEYSGSGFKADMFTVEEGYDGIGEEVEEETISEEPEVEEDEEEEDF